MEGSVLQQELKNSELDTTFDVLSLKQKTKQIMECTVFVIRNILT